MFKSPKSQSLESYLSQIAHELRDLPSQARAEEMREIESHLRAMIEARGDVAAVLAQFGAPRKVGRALRKAWERKQPEAWIRFGVALLSGLTVWMAWNVAYAKIGSHLEIPSASMMKDTLAMALFRFAFHLLLSLSFGFVVFAGMGYITKAISPKRGALAAALVISLILASRISTGGFDAPSFQLNAALFLGACIVYFVPSSIGAHFGARHGRQILSRFADGK